MRIADLPSLGVKPLTMLIVSVNAQTGQGWTLERKLEGGSNGGAHLLRDRDGRHAVLKMQIADPEKLIAADRSIPPYQRTVAAAALVGSARAAGWPTPAWLAMGATPAGDVWLLQDFVEGVQPSRIDVAVADRLIAIFERQTCLIDRPLAGWGEWISRALFEDGDGMRARIGTLPGGAELIRRIDAMVEPYRGLPISARDLVHGDMNLTNTLDGHDGLHVIDVETVGSGPRVYDLIKTMIVAGILDRATAPGLDLLWQYAATFERAEFDQCVGAAVLGIAESIVRHDLQAMAPPILARVAAFLDRAQALR